MGALHHCPISLAVTTHVQQEIITCEIFVRAENLDAVQALQFFERVHCGVVGQLAIQG
jgi:hypothetical protein